MGDDPIQVLLVEDDRDHAELISRSFEDRAGEMSLTVARSLQEARVRLADSAPEIVLIDSLLPDGRGLELLPADGEEAAGVMVLMASQGDQGMEAEAAAAGARYVVKTEEILLSLPEFIERVLRERNG